MRNRKLRRWFVIAVAVIVSVGAVTCAGNMRTKETKEAVKTVNKEEPEKREVVDLAKYVKGIKDLTVEVGASDIDWVKGITFDQEKIKEIKAKADTVDLTKPGTYKLIYLLTGKDISSESVEKEIKVTVVDSEKAAELAASGKEVLLSKNEVKIAEETSEEKPSQPEPKPEVQPSQPEPEPEVQPSQPEPKPEVQPSQPEPEPEVQPSQPEPESEVQPSQPEPKPEVQPSQPEPEPEVQPSQPEPKPEVQPSQPEPKPELKPEPEPIWVEPVYEDRWVVDQEAWDETISEPVYEELEREICNHCGVDITGNVDAHLYDHALNGIATGWHSDYQTVKTGANTYTVHHDEVGHYEQVLVQEGYWK